MVDRATYERWIASSVRTQERLKHALLPLAAIAIVLGLVTSRLAGAIALVSVAMVGLFGFWITTSHITDWEAKLRELEHPPEPQRTPAGRLRRERD